MIDLIFNYANDVLLVQIRGQDIKFATTTFGARLADISGLKLDYNGTIREFPDLKDDIEWREKAIIRFKEHIKTLRDEQAIAEYVIYELRTKGYTPKLKQIAGFRPVKLS